jgi:hypothetical protein
MICTFKGAGSSTSRGNGVWEYLVETAFKNGILTFGSASLLQGAWCKVPTKAGV